MRKIKFIKLFLPLLAISFLILPNDVQAAENEYRLIETRTYKLTTYAGTEYFLDDPVYNVDRIEFKSENQEPIAFKVNSHVNSAYESYPPDFIQYEAGSFPITIDLPETMPIDSFSYQTGKGRTIEVSFYTKMEPFNSVITDLTYTLNNNEVLFEYVLPEDDTFSHLQLYQDGQLLADDITTTSFKVTDLAFDTNYEFTFYSVDIYGAKSTGIARTVNIPENPALIPSGEIFDLTSSVTDTTVNFSYQLPTDNRFSHVKVYRDNQLITDDYKLNTFTDRNLTPETEYHYTFITVNQEGISSNGYRVTVKTNVENDTTPPEPVTEVLAKEKNSGVMLSWEPSNSPDLSHYEIYVNGEYHSKSNVNYTNITNLQNGQEYTFEVIPVDTSGNKAEPSPVAPATPSAEELPIFELPIELSGVGTSVSNWFSEIWLLVAFAVSIPLSFNIGRRIKSLFIA